MGLAGVNTGGGSGRHARALEAWSYWTGSGLKCLGKHLDLAGASTEGRDGLLVPGCEEGKIVCRVLLQHRCSEGTSTAEIDPGLGVLGSLLGSLGRIEPVGRKVLSVGPCVWDLRSGGGGFASVFVLPYHPLAGMWSRS